MTYLLIYLFRILFEADALIAGLNSGYGVSVVNTLGSLTDSITALANADVAELVNIEIKSGFLKFICSFLLLRSYYLGYAMRIVISFLLFQ